jgi:hypothetical protein
MHRNDRAHGMNTSSILYRYAQRMKRLAMIRAKWEKGNGPAWRHKRIRAIHEALSYRATQHNLMKNV